jgi:ParB/RepB/Spo0J family partition protein
MKALKNDASIRDLKRVLTVSVDEVQAKPQVRRQFRNIDALAESLLTEGQQTPIIVYPRNRAGKYIIQKGERRWRACLHAGIACIDIIVNDKKQNPLDETAGELIENIQREDLTALEIAHALHKFVDDGWKQVDIAKRLGKSTKFVSAHLGLLKLPPCVLQLYEQEVCADTDTLNILRQLHELDEERCRKLCAEANQHGIHRQLARDVLNETFIKIDSACRGTDNNRSLNVTKAQQRRDTAQHRSVPDPQTPWRPASPDRLRIIVKVARGPFSHQHGVLLTDRISDSGREVWLTLDPGKDQVLCLNADDLKIVRIEKEDS